MDKVSCKFTVLFVDPFWTGIYERTTGKKLEAAKIVFGAEPKDYEIYQYYLAFWKQMRFSPPVAETECIKKRINPKRLQRAIKKQTAQSAGIDTKAQQALKLQQEQTKENRKKLHKKRTEEEKKFQFQLSQQKKKEKKKGR